MVAYLINTTITWTLLYCIYKLFLEKEKFFQLNRFYLLASLTLGALLPLACTLVSPMAQQLHDLAQPIQQVYHSNLKNIENWTSAWIPSDQLSDSSTSPLSKVDWALMILLVYSIGVLTVGFKTIKSIAHILRIILRSDVEKSDRFNLCEVNENISPFSFFNYMIINRSNHSESERKNIIDHEIHHMERGHTIDVLIVLVFKIIFWWNPLPYLYNAALRLNHEYSADAYVLTQSSRKNYSSQLMQAAFPSVNLALTQPIFNSFIKKRITMMYQQPSKKTNLLKYGLGIMAIAFLSVLFTDSMYAYNSEGEQPQVETETLNNKGSDLEDNDTGKLKATDPVIISGTVTKEDGKPLIGVNVVIEGSNYGVITNIKGEYAIKVPDDGTVIFSYVGYDSYSATQSDLVKESNIKLTVTK